MHHSRAIGWARQNTDRATRLKNLCRPSVSWMVGWCQEFRPKAGIFSENCQLEAAGDSSGSSRLGQVAVAPLNCSKASLFYTMNLSLLLLLGAFRQPNFFMMIFTKKTYSWSNYKLVSCLSTHCKLVEMPSTFADM